MTEVKDSTGGGPTGSSKGGKEAGEVGSEKTRMCALQTDI
jgi:hypothetical protein